MKTKVIIAVVVAAIFGLGALTYFGVITPDANPVVFHAE